MNRHKKLDELVIEDSFNVTDVLSESEATTQSLGAHLQVGGRNPIHKTGYTTVLTLKVTPTDKNSPIRTIKFLGYSTVKRGDFIYAKIPRFESHTERSTNRMLDKTIYSERNFREEESAIEITIHAAGPIRTDRSVDYSTYFPN